MRFNFSNKLAYTLVLFGILVAIAVGINALAPGVAPNPGHTLDNIAPPSGCASGEFLKWNDPNWDCVSVPASGGDITGVTAGTGLLGGGLSGDVALSADTNYLQRKLTLTTAYNVGPNYGVFSLNMGNHLFCFLTSVADVDSLNGGCSINIDTSWWLTSSGDATCGARCVD